MKRDINDMDSNILDRIEKKASEYEYRYHGCGQCVLQALMEELNLPGGSTVLKTAGFNGAGIARMQHMCGALMAGIMAMWGLLPDAKISKTPSFRVI